MTQLEKVLYTGKTHTSGGRVGTSRSSDGRLDVRLSSPGAPGTGTNPEQLLAAAWSACFISTIKQEAEQTKVPLPASVGIDAEVDLSTTGGTYFLRVRFNVRLPGVEGEAARTLVDSAHQGCPFFKATRGNVDVAINLL
jgi:osmotically inducible protein OsmC